MNGKEDLRAGECSLPVVYLVSLSKRNRSTQETQGGSGGDGGDRGRGNRRAFSESHIGVDALGVASDVCYRFIDDIELLFANERLFKDMPATERGKPAKDFAAHTQPYICDGKKSYASEHEHGHGKHAVVGDTMRVDYFAIGGSERAVGGCGS